jgi:hypothetical protein
VEDSAVYICQNVLEEGRVEEENPEENPEEKQREKPEEKQKEKPEENESPVLNFINKITIYFNMKFGDMILALLIILVFVGMYVFSTVSVGLKNIKKNWPKYRCNPMAMPLAGQLGFDPMENFTFCITKMQSNAMGFFLEPIHFLVGMMGNLGKELSGAINMVRNVIAYIRGMVGNIVGDIFGVFMNILIQIQTMMIKIKDLAMKLVGVMTTTMYIIGTSMKLGQSIWAGPVGGILRTLCFKGTTLVTLKSGKQVAIKDINLGDTLINDSSVIGTLKLKGDKSNPYYKIWSRDLEDYIYVTGEHRILNDGDVKILDDKFENYIKVSYYGNAEKTNKHDAELYCLITSDHRIPIGEYTFWDWED